MVVRIFYSPGVCDGYTEFTAKILNELAGNGICVFSH
jgi:hypothetical protein